MDANKVKLFVRICAIYASNGKLDLENQEIICLYEECLLMASFLKDITTLTIIYYLLGMFYKGICHLPEAIKALLVYLDIVTQTGYKRGEGDACRNIGNAFLALGNYQDAIKYHEKDLAVAVEINDKKLEANAHGALGNAYFSWERYHKAKEHYVKNLRIAVEISDRSEEGKASGRLGTVYHVLANYNDAIKCHNKALEIAVESGDRSLEGKTYGNLGNAYHSLGEFQKAIEYHEKDLKIAIEMADKAGEGQACMNLGNALDSLARYDEAQRYYEKQLNIAKEMNDKDGEGKAYANLGNVYQALGDYHKAIEYHEKSLTIAKEIKYRSGEGKCYGNLGNAYHSLGKCHESIKYHEKCLGIAIQFCDRSGEASAYGNIGNVFYSLGQYSKAIEYHEKHLSVAKEIGDREQEGHAFKNIGNAYDATGEYHKAIEYHEKSLKIALQIGDRHGEAGSYGNLGNAYDSLGQYHKAIEYHYKNINIAKQIGDRGGEAKAYGNLGNSQNSLGQYLKSITNHQKFLNIAIEIKDRFGEHNAYGSLGTDYHALGNYGEAIKCYEKCISIALETDAKSGEGSAYGSLGNVYMSLGKCEQAIKYYEKALSNAALLGNKHAETKAYGNLGTTYCSLGKYEQALEFLNKNLVVAVKVGDRKGEGKCYGNIGNVYRSIDQFDDAINHLEQCLRIAKDISDRKTEGYAYFCIGMCYYQLFSHYRKQQDETKGLSCIQESEKYLNKCLLCHERLFDELEEQDQLKISIVDTFISAYRLLTMLYIETKEVRQALLVTERGRARALADILMAKYSMSSSGDAGSNSPLEYSDIEKTVANRDSCILVFALVYRFVATWVLTDQDVFFSGCSIKGFEPSISELFSKIDNKELVVTCINKIVNKVHECLRVREEVTCEDRSLEELQNPCHREIGAEKAPSLCQEKERDSSESNKNNESQSNVRCIYDEEEFEANPLEALFNAFVAPVQNKLKQDEVVIIPDGPLFAVPYAALRDPKTGLFLSEMMRIRIAPSLTTLKVLQESSANHHCNSGALIVGCPDVGKVIFRGKRTKFQHLGFAKQEAEEISKSLGVRALTGRDATKNVIKQRLQEGVSVIHFATHGSNNGEIILAPAVSTDEENIPEEEDYVLTMREAQQIGIRAQLVVLSCCHSGRGEIRSEGVIGMSRAFLAAGARAVVASLWAIDDEATKVFMLKFYSHLKRGESASESLQQAMKEMREIQGRYSEPKYWAPFILIGDNVTVSL